MTAAYVPAEDILDPSPSSQASVSSLRPSPLSTRYLGTVFFEDVELDPEAEWLVDGVLPDNALSAIWGEPGSGKSFMALDIALAVAAGGDWFGRACGEGGVAYLAAEGGRGVKKRLIAYRNRHGARNLPFALIPAALDLCTKDHETEALISELEGVQGMLRVPLRLVVIDTLSRTMGGGNENDSQDMGALIRNADRIREATGAHVMFVHHGGKDKDKKTRGHSSLYGALDTAIEVTASEVSGLRTARIRKQKDGEDGITFTFRLDVETVAKTDTGEITSCVVVPEEADVRDADQVARKISGVNAIALDALRKAIVEYGTVPPASNHIPPGVSCVSPDLWRRCFYNMRSSETSDANKKAFKRATVELQNRGFSATWGDFSWLI